MDERQENLEQLEQTKAESKPAGLNRRKFIGALGGAAAAGALLETMAQQSMKADDTQYSYQDSFGNIVPAGSGAIALGIYPPSPEPPLENDQLNLYPQNQGRAPLLRRKDAGNSPTYYHSGYPKYNFLLVMVDQMRAPGFWPATAGGSVLSNLPNISTLASTSLYLPNYFTAATVCGPARACLLTGLYAQQHFLLKSDATGTPNPSYEDAAANMTASPPLLPYNSGYTGNGCGEAVGFPTIGNVLSQSLPVNGGGGNAQYDCTWIGKWHVSCELGSTSDTTPGAAGPNAYGFSNQYSLPNSKNTKYARTNPGYPSPNGFENEGNGGDFLDSFVPGATTDDEPNYASSITALTPPGTLIQLNDAAIAWAFTAKWLPHAPASPWFCAVSFVNPHDISDFPYPFNLTVTGNPEGYTVPTAPMSNGYQPPPTAGISVDGTHCQYGATHCGADGDHISILPLPSPYSAPPSPWNWEDPSTMEYTTSPIGGKPGLQAYFENLRNQQCGTIPSPSLPLGNPLGWQTFLNYYVWMQICVDTQIGNVLYGPTGILGDSAYASMAANTIIVFTSDHGEYGGSHGIHAKGGALYDEVMNVPLYVHFPGQTQSGVVRYVCSGVDLLPMFYELALGNSSWRTNTSDMVNYLANREAIADAIYQYTVSGVGILQQRRTSTIRAFNLPPGSGIMGGQPYVLHTADDIALATNPSTGAKQPSHAIAFRTCDITDPISNPVNGQTSCGGGKLGIYSYWETCGASGPPIQGLNTALAPNQYEFYNFSPNPPGGDSPAPSVNIQEMGNQYSASTGMPLNETALYLSNFQSAAIQNELYYLYSGNGSPNAQVSQAVQVAFANYLCYLSCTKQLTDNTGTHPTSGCSGSCLAYANIFDPNSCS